MFIDGTGDGKLVVARMRLINGYQGYGGAMYIVTATTIDIISCVFENNVAYSSSGGQYGGGALFIFQGNTVTIADSIFQNNQSPRGDDIYLYSSATLLLAAPTEPGMSLKYEEIYIHEDGSKYSICR